MFSIFSLFGITYSWTVIIIGILLFGAAVSGYAGAILRNKLLCLVVCFSFYFFFIFILYLRVL